MFDRFDDLEMLDSYILKIVFYVVCFMCCKNFYEYDIMLIDIDYVINEKNIDFIRF